VWELGWRPKCNMWFLSSNKEVVVLENGIRNAGAMKMKWDCHIFGHLWRSAMAVRQRTWVGSVTCGAPWCR